MKGYEIRVMDDEGKEVEKGKMGNIIIKVNMKKG